VLRRIAGALQKVSRSKHGRHEHRADEFQFACRE
jgi:hypothetical protein